MLPGLLIVGIIITCCLYTGALKSCYQALSSNPGFPISINYIIDNGDWDISIDVTTQCSTDAD